jgi:hypothetical protein
VVLRAFEVKIRNFDPWRCTRYPALVSDTMSARSSSLLETPKFVGMTLDEALNVSGHSVRVGATQGDMLALNIDLAPVMQAGRWKTTAIPMRYGEDIQAGLGGMARIPKPQGRAIR